MSECPINLTKSAEDLVEEILSDHPELGEINKSISRAKGKGKTKKRRGKILRGGNRWLKMLAQFLAVGAAILTPQQVTSAEKILACSSDTYHHHEEPIFSLPTNPGILPSPSKNDKVMNNNINEYAKFIVKDVAKHERSHDDDDTADSKVMESMKTTISKIITDESITTSEELFRSINSFYLEIADNIHKNRRLYRRSITEKNIWMFLVNMYTKEFFEKEFGAMTEMHHLDLIKKNIDIDQTIQIFEILMRLPEKSITKEIFIEYLDIYQEKLISKNIELTHEDLVRFEESLIPGMVLTAVAGWIWIYIFMIGISWFLSKYYYANPMYISYFLHRSFTKPEELTNYKTYLENHGFHQRIPNAKTSKKKLKKSKRLKSFLADDINPDSLDTYIKKNPNVTIQHFTAYKHLTPQIAYMHALSPDKMDSIQTYTTNYYRYINSLSSFYKNDLRESLLTRGLLYDEIINMIKNIDKIFENIPPITHPLTTYRCYRTGILVSPKENKKIEDQFKSFQYISTTLSYEYALEWCTDYNTQTAFIDSAMIEIRIPKGVKILPIYTVSTLPAEKEVLLDRRGFLKRLLINPRKPTTTNYVFEYVPPDYDDPSLSKVKEKSTLIQNFLDSMRLPNPFA